MLARLEQPKPSACMPLTFCLTFFQSSTLRCGHLLMAYSLQGPLQQQPRSISISVP